jgi:AcrR family transcriptional regulator
VLVPAAVTSATAPRRRLTREARSRQLLEVAESVFAARGVRSATMDEVAEAAGVTKPVLYDHFGSKDRLLAEVVLRAGALLADTVLAAVEAAASPEAALADGLAAYFGFIEQRRSGLHSLLTEGVVPGSAAAKALETVRNQQAEMIAALLLAHGVDQADSDDGGNDAAVRVRMYAQIVVGATERLATRPGGEAMSVAELTGHVMDVIWCGFATLRDGGGWEPSGHSHRDTRRTGRRK